VNILEDIAYWLAAMWSQETKLAGIIYLHKITDGRMLGSAKRNLRMFKNLTGSANLGSVVLATTHWTDSDGRSVPEDVGQRRITELTETKEFWGEMVARGSRVEKHDGTGESAQRIVSELVARQIKVVLDIQRNLIDDHMKLQDTGAGQALQAEIREERERSEREIALLRRDLAAAQRERDIEWQNEIESARASHAAAIEKGKEDMQALQKDMQDLIRTKERQIKAVEAKMAEFEKEKSTWARDLEELKAEQAARDEKYFEEKREHEETDKVKQSLLEEELKRWNRQYEKEKNAQTKAAERKAQDWADEKAALKTREGDVQSQLAEANARLDDLVAKNRQSTPLLLWRRDAMVNARPSPLLLIHQNGFKSYHKPLEPFTNTILYTGHVINPFRYINGPDPEKDDPNKWWGQ
jgi:hypothetical protein